MDINTFQNEATDWMVECFGHDLATTRKERAQRFIEEALELAQAEGLTREDCDLMVNYVYSRPVGNTAQEVGGVMLTLAGVCWRANIHMNAATVAELRRVQQPEMIEKIRAKQASKSAILGITSQDACERVERIKEGE